MHSYIVCNGTKDDRQQKVKRLVADLRQEEKYLAEDILSCTDPDILLLQPDPTITIDAVRQLKSTLKLKPYASKCKIALIVSADLLTLQAQHALLKTLEEPTPNTFLVLELKNQHELLPTIRSRCQIIRTSRRGKHPCADNGKQVSSITNLLRQGSPGSRMRGVEKLIQRNDAKNILEDLLFVLAEKMRQDPHWAPAVGRTQQALEDLKNNLNPNLTLEHFAINFPRIQPLVPNREQNATLAANSPTRRGQ